MEKTKFSSKISEKENIEILYDKNLIGKKVFINWSLEILKTTSCLNLLITIDSVHFYGIKDKTGEYINFQIAPELCKANVVDVQIADDIFPKMLKLDSETKKCEILF